MPRHPHIIPPIYRICEHIAGPYHSIIIKKLGLDSAKYKFQQNAGRDDFEEDDLVNYKPPQVWSIWNDLKMDKS